jgi:hypothetical protein
VECHDGAVHERVWNQPWFHPASGISAFTENLVGLAPIATPAYW